jgi:DNA-binding HxlR family transcriptional regulator
LDRDEESTMNSADAQRVINEETVAAGALRPRLRAVQSGESRWASESDREMMAAAAGAVGLISAKWKVELLFLLAAQVRRHSRLQDHLLVSKKVLSETLKALVRDGLVSRTVYPDVPVRVEYSLTALGRSLTAPLFALYEWMDERSDEVQAAREQYDRCNGVSTSSAGPSSEPPRFSAGFQVREPEAADAGAGRFAFARSGPSRPESAASSC